MNNKRKIVLLMGILITIALLFPSISIAQVEIDPGCDPMDPACPIDGGITLLIAAGIGLGARKAFRNKNK